MDPSEPRYSESQILIGPKVIAATWSYTDLIIACSLSLSLTHTCTHTCLWSGVPQIVHSDNGPCHSCKELKDFAEEYDYRHMTSSPLFPQSNGKAEKGVHIVKQILKKAQDSGSDPYLALLSYRASPLEHGKSPAEFLMGRRLRTTLPYTVQGKKHKAVRQKLKQLQKRQKNNYDIPSRSLAPLARRDTVRVQDSNIWSKKASVLEEVSPRSYSVQTEDGQILWRKLCLLKTQKTLSVSAPVSPVLRRLNL
uniref:Integrase catalytic domain-containing protein n=1 Tax=Gouania willdenowi TaxID=441366 RepID=A0A8C5N550_GOUWI